MKYIFRRERPQGNPRDILRFDSNPQLAIAGQYGFQSVRLHELEEKATPEKRWFYVFATNEGREIRFGELEMLTTLGIIARLREHEH